MIKQEMEKEKKKKEDDDAKQRERIVVIRKFVLGIGFWVQGMRCYPWMAVIFFLKDTLHLDPSSLQILQNSSNLPMVAKPFYGLLSDSFYIRRQHRLPYIALGALLQAVSWLAIAFLSSSSTSTISFLTITLYLLLGNLGASLVEVANDAIVAETSKQPTPTPSSKASSKKPPPPSSSQSQGLQSFVWMASSIGGVLGNLLGGLSIDRFSPNSMFLFFGLLLTLQFLLTICISETSLDLPKNTANHGIRKQLSELLLVLRKPDISRSIAWFAASYAIIPALTGTMFYYQTEHLNIESSVLGISKVFGQAAMLLWGVMYNRHLKSIQPRKLIAAIQATMALFMISDVLFVNGFYRNLGVNDSVYVVAFSGLLEVLYFFKILPFSVLIAKLCPAGCEGSLMAFVMSSVALAFILSGYLGVALASYVGVTGNDFSGLPRGLLIQAAATALPLIWSSCIPHDASLVPKTTKKKEN